MNLLPIPLRGLFLVGGLMLLTASLASAQGTGAPAPAGTAPKAADATKPADANKAAVGSAIPVGTTKPEAAAKPTAPAAPPPAAIDWKSMDHKARKAHMKKVVTPAMKKAFIAFDNKRYKAFGCVTCHGAEGIEKNTYKMPNPKLPRLPKDMAGFEALAKKEPKAMKFMAEEVKPKMAAMLGMPEYKPETGTGFGCNACHMSEGQ
jgi:hypothetical protein